MSESPSVVPDNGAEQHPAMKTEERLQLAKFKPLHLQIAQLYVMGKSYAEIAEIVGWHQQSVMRVIKSDIMQVEISRLQGKMDNIMFEADLRMKSLVHRSLDVLDRVLDDKLIEKKGEGDLEMQVKVASKVLDGVLGMRRGEGSSHVTHIQNIQQIMVDASVKSDNDLVKDVMARVKASKEVK
jgi:hypothetical protein